MSMEEFKPRLFKKEMSEEEIKETQKLIDVSIKDAVDTNTSEDIRMEHTGKGWKDPELTKEVMDKFLKEKLSIETEDLLTDIDNLEADLAVLAVKYQIGKGSLTADHISEFNRELENLKNYIVKGETIIRHDPNSKDAAEANRYVSNLKEEAKKIRAVISNKAPTITPEEEETELLSNYKDIAKIIDSYKRFLAGRKEN